MAPVGRLVAVWSLHSCGDVRHVLGRRDVSRISHSFCGFSEFARRQGIRLRAELEPCHRHVITLGFQFKGSGFATLVL